MTTSATWTEPALTTLATNSLMSHSGISLSNEISRDCIDGLAPHCSSGCASIVVESVSKAACGGRAVVVTTAPETAGSTCAQAAAYGRLLQKLLRLFLWRRRGDDDNFYRYWLVDPCRQQLLLGRRLQRLLQLRPGLWGGNDDDDICGDCSTCATAAWTIAAETATMACAAAMTTTSAETALE